jgi:hypothetical protein
VLMVWHQQLLMGDTMFYRTCYKSVYSNKINKNGGITWINSIKSVLMQKSMKVVQISLWVESLLILSKSIIVLGTHL